MHEIRLHGRGGQGAAMAAEMLATAFVLEGKYAASFPMFGFERRGAPVSSFVRFDFKPIRERTRIYQPDCLVVLDPRMKNSPVVFSGLKQQAVMVLNTPKAATEAFHPNLKIVGSIDATGIAIQEVGLAVTNTCMLGAFAATTRWLTLSSVMETLKVYFSDKLLEQNMRCAERGFHEVKVAAL